MPNKVLRTEEDTEVFCPRQYIQNRKPYGYFLLDEDKKYGWSICNCEIIFWLPTAKFGRNLEKTNEEQTYQFVLSIISSNFLKFFRGCSFWNRQTSNVNSPHLVQIQKFCESSSNAQMFNQHKTILLESSTNLHVHCSRATSKLYLYFKALWISSFYFRN